MRYGIWCVRSASSVFGSASAWMKVNDEIWTADEAAAKAEAERLNKSAMSRNVRYAAKPLD